MERTGSGSLRPEAALACLLGAAVAQGLAAVIFFFAANWWAMPAWVKVALVDGALGTAALAAIAASAGGLPRAAAAFAGATLSGLLFAVHGQIWQTGADAWELFALWGALAAGWALASGATGVWVAAASLGALASVLAAAQLGWASPLQSGCVLAASVAAAVWIARRSLYQRWPQQAAGAWFEGVAAALVFVPLTIGGAVAALDLGVGSAWAWATAVALVALAATFRWTRSSYPGYALAVLSLAAVALSFGLSPFVMSLTDIDEKVLAVGLLLVGGVVIEATRRILLHLIHIRVAFADPDGRAAVPAQGNPDIRSGGLWHPAVEVSVALLGWWGAALVGGGVLILIWLFLPKSADLVSWAGTAAVAFGALALTAGRLADGFGRRMAAPFAVAAWSAALVAVGEAARATHLPHPNLIAAVVAALALPRVLAVARTAEAGFIAGAILAVVWAEEVGHLGAWASWLWVPAAALLALACLEASDGLPALRGAALSLAASAFFAPWGVDVLPHLGLAAGQPGLGEIGVRVAGVLSAAALIAWSLSRLGTTPGLRVRALLAAALAGCLALPGAAAGVLGLSAVAMARRSVALLAFALMGGAWALVRFYHALEMPLDRKAGVIGLGALACGAAWAALARPRLRRPAGRFHLAAALTFSACAALPVGLEAWSAWDMGRVARDGTRVLLPLRPRDPRSILQGDYMAMAYDPGLLDRVAARCRERSERVLVLLDGGGVAVSARADDSAPRPGEIAARVLGEPCRPRLAPDSFLFPEGTAADWARARYAEARFLDGRGLLVGLADERGEPIRPGGRPGCGGAGLVEGGCR